MVAVVLLLALLIELVSLLVDELVVDVVVEVASVEDEQLLVVECSLDELIGSWSCSSAFSVFAPDMSH